MPSASDLASPSSVSTAPRPRGFAGRGLACLRGERLVFRGLDFTLPPGGALILLGPNGSGKSSLLRIMAGLSAPIDGNLFWDDVNLREAPEAHRARLHFIGHADALKPVLTAEETLRFWALMRGGEASAIRAALDQFGLAAAADLPCRYLSAGQKRRLALARLIASTAPLWLLDEPTTGLDAEGTAQLLAAIAAHRHNGGSVVLSTHIPVDLPSAAHLSLADFRPRGREFLSEDLSEVIA